MFKSLSMLGDMECKVKDQDFRHRYCLEKTAGMFKDGEAWLSAKLSKLMKGFPTQDQRDYMARQRDKCGFKVLLAMPEDETN